MKFLYYFLNRFKPKNRLRTFLVYGAAILIFTIYGVEGLMLTFFLGLFFVLGWLTHSLVSAIKDYRLTLRLNRVHFSHSDYETLKRENKSLLIALQSYMKDATVHRGGKRGRVAPQSPSMDSTRMSAADIEELRLRYEMEEKET